MASTGHNKLKLVSADFENQTVVFKTEFFFDSWEITMPMKNWVDLDSPKAIKVRVYTLEEESG